MSRSIPIYPLQRVFYPKNLSCTPKIRESLYAAIHLGYKNNKTEQIYPQFQNAMGTQGSVHSSVNKSCQLAAIRFG